MYNYKILTKDSRKLDNMEYETMFKTICVN